MKKAGVYFVIVAVGLIGGPLDWQATAQFSPSFGDPLADLTQKQLERFEFGKVEFTEEEEREDGLGPVFNDVCCSA